MKPANPIRAFAIVRAEPAVAVRVPAFGFIGVCSWLANCA